MKSIDRIVRLANSFERKMHKISQQFEVSMTPDQVDKILNDSNLWGGIPIDINGPIADIIFNAMDKVGFHGKFNASLIIGPKYTVKILVDSDNNKTLQLQNVLQNYFGSKMQQALSKSNISAPDGDLTVPWLENIANVQ